MSENLTKQLLAAAKALLEARENQMLARIEWQALAEAVAEFTCDAAGGQAEDPSEYP